MNIEVAIAELRRRAQTVPIPLRLPSEAEVATAESRIGVAFPRDYRRYLLEGSDVVFDALEPASVVPDGDYLDLADMARTAWDLGVSRDLLPFCEDNGDYYCLTRAGPGPVLVAQRDDRRVVAGPRGLDHRRLDRRERRGRRTRPNRTTIREGPQAVGSPGLLIALLVGSCSLPTFNPPKLKALLGPAAPVAEVALMVWDSRQGSVAAD